MAKFKALWLSRHELTEEQKEDLFEYIVPICVKKDEFEIVTLNVTWQATKDKRADIYANIDTWGKLLDEHEPNIVLGVFPPAALEAAKLFRPNLALFSPISEQNATMRADGSRQIEFIHVRWSDNLNE